MAPQAPAPGSRGLGRPRCGWVHAVGGGAGHAAGCLWTRGAHCLPGPARSASPLWLQQRPQSILLAWAPGPPTGRSFTGCWNPRPGCTSAPSPGTWKVSLPRCAYIRPPSRSPAAAAVEPQRRGSAEPGDGVGGKGALSGWTPGFQLQFWGKGRAGTLLKACAPSSLGTQLQRPACSQTQAQKRASGGQEGQERRTRERRQRLELGEVGRRQYKRRVRRLENTGKERERDETARRNRKGEETQKSLKEGTKRRKKKKQ